MLTMQGEGIVEAEVELETRLHEHAEHEEGREAAHEDAGPSRAAPGRGDRPRAGARRGGRREPFRSRSRLSVRPPPRLLFLFESVLRQAAHVSGALRAASSAPSAVLALLLR